MKALALVGLFFGFAQAQYFGTYHCSGGRDAHVHLFEWKWADIQRECSWLAQNGYCAVQVSPPTEHRVIDNPFRPWYQRYQPASHGMHSRSGTETEFRNMVTACNNAGVYIYVDAVVNHMTGGGWGTASGGCDWSGDAQSYPCVPFGNNDFNGRAECPTGSLEIEDYQSIIQVRNCRLVGLRDLKLGTEYVRSKTAELFNKWIGWGVAGFRIDASKHMWPGDMQNVLGRLNNLNTQWFPSGTRPFIFMEVIDMGGEPITGGEYTAMGRVTEFKYGKNLGDVIRKNFGQRLAYLRNFGEGWGFLPGLNSHVFVDNHDNQRGHGAGGFGSILTFFEGNQYKMANAFMLAWPYGYPRIMSSYNWPREIGSDGKDRNDWIGPPSDGSGNTETVTCFNGKWICEHRWRQISNMVKFHNAAVGTAVTNWWDNGQNAIAFSRGNKAFFAMNNEGNTVSQRFNTGLPGGQYCDVISCDNNRPPCGNSGGGCKGSINVDGGGWADVSVQNGQDPMVAYHI